MAEPRLDCLPMELLLMIFEEGCEKADIAHLILCNKRLQKNLEPVLYDNIDTLSKVMRWACLKGNIDTIHKCIWYGASVHNSTYLCLASKKQQEKVIRLLIDLGVRILSPEMDKHRRFRGIKEFRYCANHLCSSRLSHEQSSNLLRLLYEKAIDEQGRKKWDADTVLPLITLIKSPAGAPMDLIRQVLDDGADPNEPRPYKDRDSLSPLSAAIIANSEPAFHLLLERGASIHGAPIKSWAKVGLHIPIFAAAMMLAVADHGKTTMQLCLDNGADINYERICPESYGEVHNWLRGCKRRKRHYSPGEDYTNTTPLLVFLDSIKSFKSPKLPNPVERLNWFFEHATGWEAPNITDKRRPRAGTNISAVSDVLGKWGLGKFREPGFTEIIRILLRHQIFDRDPLHMYLRKWLSHLNDLSFYLILEEKLAKEEDVKRGLATLTTVLVENLQFNIRWLLPFESIDDVLANFIRDRPIEPVRRAQDFDYIIIETLLASGANINATNAIYDIERYEYRSGLKINAENTIYNCGRYELSALHFWCSELNKSMKDNACPDARGKLQFGHPWIKSMRDAARLDASGQLRFGHPWIYTDWIPLLIKYGADPTMPAGEERKTALDLLVAEDPSSSSQGQSSPTEEAVRKHLQDLATLWKKLHEDRPACGKEPTMQLTQRMKKGQ